MIVILGKKRRGTMLITMVILLNFIYQIFHWITVRESLFWAPKEGSTEKSTFFFITVKLKGLIRWVSMITCFSPLPYSLELRKQEERSLYLWLLYQFREYCSSECFNVPFGFFFNKLTRNLNLWKVSLKRYY